MEKYDLLEILNFADKLVQILESQRSEINDVITKYHSNDTLKWIGIGDHDVIGVYPSITIEIPGINIEPIGTHYAMDVVPSGSIAIRIKEVLKEYMFRFQYELAMRVLEILIQPCYNRIEVGNGFIYNFNVFGKTTFGAEKAGAVRTSRIPFEAHIIRAGF